ncbi:MAG: hypothetical protein R3330_09130, partial [Saprospiraceae bacterium]|nr:hypothetical protein [Saprospiraceae bacterium]
DLVMVRKLRRSILIGITALTIAFAVAPTVQTEAQCPMCRMSAESNLKNGGTAGKGLNKGILYLFVMPYLLVGTFGIIWWRNRQLEGVEDE